MSPAEMLLDNSYHFAAMKRLHDSFKRGRPDIIHFALMEALSTPLFLQRKLRVYVHTVNGKIIAIADNLRIPKSYFRFERLMVKLFTEGSVKSNEGGILMEIVDGTFEGLLRSLAPDSVIGLSTTGVKSTAADVAKVVAPLPNSAIVIGAFPKGHFSERTTKHLGPTYAISDIALEAHVVIARILYECEKVLLEKGVDHEGNK